MAEKGRLENAKHFKFEQPAKGIYACIHKPGGAAFSNAGIIDLGERTLVVDACETMAAGRELRQTAEALFDRPVDTIVLTHWHADHWVGASSFEPGTSILASEITRQLWAEEAAEIVEEFKDPLRWKEELQAVKKKLAAEQDKRVRAGLENSILRRTYVLAEMQDYRPRFADLTFENEITLQGSQRTAQVISFGQGHSQEDAVILFPGDNVAFIGDIGFFDCQPFMGSCELDLYRKQLHNIQASNYRTLVPGHGPVGNIERDISAQLKYLDVMEKLVGDIVRKGGSFEQAMMIILPEPFDQWLMGGMGRFETNVRYLYTHFGGELPPGS